MFITPIDTSALDAGKTSTATKPDSATDPNAAQDRFLKLLVAQLSNQDPMNPMDNAQMTSQMAQINTVTGIQQLNLTMQTMANQFAAMQSLQGTAMIGRSVLTEGSKLSYTGGAAQGAFELAGAATAVKVEVITPGGQVVHAQDLGAQEQGRHDFTWDASGYTGDKSTLSFRVTATNKDGAVTATNLMQSKVVGTGTSAGALTLSLDTGGTVKYTDVRAVL